MCDTNTFTCFCCNSTLDWVDCVAEEVLSRMGFSEPTCYACVAEGNATLESQMRQGVRPFHRDEDFSTRAEDPYDDRDFVYDWE